MLSDPLDDDSFSADYYEIDNKQIPYKSVINAETEDYLAFQQLDMFSQGFHIMEEFRRDEKLCDVILKVNYTLLLYVLVLTQVIIVVFFAYTHTHRLTINPSWGTESFLSPPYPILRRCSLTIWLKVSKKRFRYRGSMRCE